MGSSRAASLSVERRAYVAHDPRWRRFLRSSVLVGRGRDRVRQPGAAIVVLRRTERVPVDAAGVCREVVGRELTVRRMAADHTGSG